MVTFAVSDVKRETSPLRAAATRRQIAMLGWPAPETYRISADELIGGPRFQSMSVSRRGRRG